MYIYMVRHGESEGNVVKKIQDLSAKLSKTGEMQARAVAKRLEGIGAGVVISSTAERAVKTAHEIATLLGKEHIQMPLFIERSHPSRFVGISRLTPEFLEYEKIRNSKFADPNWRYEDGENFYDVKNRAIKAMEYLEKRNEEHIVVVSHGIFMREFLGVVLYGDKYSYELFDGIMKFHTTNTGITVYKIEKIEQKHVWSVLTWNDYSHLPS